MPKGVQPVRDFELNRYLGKWYEIARLDHSFERGLNQVTAQYTLRKDGKITVLNRGYSEKQRKWKQARGTARPARSPNEGFLKVSFFWPFSGSYVVAELDRENYSFALVTGPNHKYLWILSRTPQMDPDVYDRLVNRARELGFDVSGLIVVRHEP